MKKIKYSLLILLVAFGYWCINTYKFDECLAESRDSYTRIADSQKVQSCQDKFVMIK